MRIALVLLIALAACGKKSAPQTPAADQSLGGSAAESPPPPPPEPNSAEGVEGGSTGDGADPDEGGESK